MSFKKFIALNEVKIIKRTGKVRRVLLNEKTAVSANQ